MLFDLTGRRRGVVRVVYAVLALLLAGGLLVGVGTATGVNPFTEGGTTGGSIEEQAEQRIERAQAAVARNPRDPAALAAVVRARVDSATATANPETGAYTAPGRAQLRRADQQWTQYLDLDPEDLDGRTAQRMVNAYSTLNQPAKAADAQEIVVSDALARARAADQEPPYQPTLLLASLLYQAGQDDQAERAGRQATALAPSSQRSTVRQQLEALQAQAAQAAAGGAASGGAAAPAG